MKSKININVLIKYIKKIPTREEKILVEEWLNESDENRKNYESFLYYWNVSGGRHTGFTPDIKEGWMKIKSKTVDKDENKQVQTKLNIIKVAAAVLLLFGLTWCAISMFNNRFLLLQDKVEYIASDKVKKVILSDNSIVWLNTGSQLITPRQFNNSQRRVSLTGEAFFDIKSNSHNPFYVKTGKTLTRVLGTSFNIESCAGDNSVNITVETGRVAFYKTMNRSGRIILEPGDMGIYNEKTRTLEKRKNTDMNYLSWKTRKLVFRNTSLKNVCKALNDYYHINILNSELQENDLVFTGSFYEGLLEETLEVIELTLDIKFIKINEEDNPTFMIRLNN
ncbi:MAG: FecR domain-containing protein [Bacteroidales bacterium]|nr:MAG: FecR domain-containing protein [Bacteroidales bacterium]